MPDPLHSLHCLLMRWCSQMLALLRSLHALDPDGCNSCCLLCRGLAQLLTSSALACSLHCRFIAASLLSGPARFRIDMIPWFCALSPLNASIRVCSASCSVNAASRLRFLEITWPLNAAALGLPPAPVPAAETKEHATNIFTTKGDQQTLDFETNGHAGSAGSQCGLQRTRQRPERYKTDPTLCRIREVDPCCCRRRCRCRCRAVAQKELLHYLLLLHSM